MNFKRILRIRSHAGHARYLADIDFAAGGEIPRQDIPSPYCYSPTHTLHRDERGRLVFIVETSHRCFDVFHWLGGAA